MVKNIVDKLEQANNKTNKPYEPLKFEMITLTKDVILASTFDTKGIYDSDWIIFDTKYLW